MGHIIPSNFADLCQILSMILGTVAFKRRCLILCTNFADLCPNLSGQYITASKFGVFAHNSTLFKPKAPLLGNFWGESREIRGLCPDFPTFRAESRAFGKFLGRKQGNSGFMPRFPHFPSRKSGFWELGVLCRFLR